MGDRPRVRGTLRGFWPFGVSRDQSHARPLLGGLAILCAHRGERWIQPEAERDGEREIYRWRSPSLILELVSVPTSREVRLLLRGSKRANDGGPQDVDETFPTWAKAADPFMSAYRALLLESER